MACGPLLITLLGGDAHKLPRHNVVRDWRIAVLRAVLHVLVVVYIAVFDLALFHRYATFEAPTGYTNVWAVRNPAMDAVDPSTLPYCQEGARDAYAWGSDFNDIERQLTGDFLAENISCAAFDLPRDTSVIPGSFNVLSFEGRMGPNDTRISASRLVVAPELATFNMIHTFTASWFDKGVSNPRTEVLDKQGRKRFEFAPGTIVSGVTIGDWLDLAGVSLDERSVAQWFRGGALEEQVHYRVSGMVLIVRLKYLNKRDWTLGTENVCEITVEQLPGAWGWLGPQPTFNAELGREEIAYRNFVSLQFVTSGVVGRFEFTNVVMSLVQGVVLFSLATYVVDSTARTTLREHLLARAEAEGEKQEERKALAEARARAEAREGGDGATEDSAAAVTPDGDRIFSVRPRDALSLTCARGRLRVAARPATLRDAVRERSSRRALSRSTVAPTGGGGGDGGGGETAGGPLPGPRAGGNSGDAKGSP